MALAGRGEAAGQSAAGRVWRSRPPLRPLASEVKGIVPILCGSPPVASPA